MKMGNVPKAVPSAIAPSYNNSVPILSEAQLGPYKPMSGSAIIPVVPRTEQDDNGQMHAQPGYGGVGKSGGELIQGSEGSPSVPGMNGVLFTSGPIDSHYVSEFEAKSPYAKINNPPTRGMFTWVKDYLNGISLGQQNKTETGFNQRSPQQRTSWMRITTPPHGDGYSPETFTPRQQPQRPNTAKFLPATGTQGKGTGVLNSSTFGAGQTAGGIGGNQYTPTPGPPTTNSTASQDIANGRGTMPTWG
jgi:hypothetical protein